MPVTVLNHKTTFLVASTLMVVFTGNCAQSKPEGLAVPVIVDGLTQVIPEFTAQGPSYLHGWSPNKKHLIYTAQRNGVYDIYKIPVSGGHEIQLTRSKGLDDGSEYSPDGKAIYFCSTRTGTMQIWKVDSDGQNQTQLTFDALNDWFPHVSPNNQWLVFLSFPKDIPADQHPFYQRVYLRLMPVSGGDIKVIGYHLEGTVP